MLKPFKSMAVRLAACLVLAGFLTACQDEVVNPVSEAEAKLHAAPRPARIFTVSDQVGLIERRFAGRVAAVKTVDLSFQVPGKLVELPIRESQRVSKGDLIAKLDTEDYDRAVREAKINVDQAKRDLDRLATLKDRLVISQSSYDAQKNKYDLAVEAQKEARQNLKYAEIKAPFDGLAALRLVDNFTIIDVGTPVLRLHDISEIQVDINVAEALFGRITESEVAAIQARFPAYGDQLFDLEYREHSSQVDDVAQTYRVTLAMPGDGAEQLAPGMTASVTVKFLPEGLDLKDLLLIPSSAVVVDGAGKAFVWVFDKDTGAVTKRLVQIGTIMGDYIPVTEGLMVGDEIVSAGVAYLSEGQIVRRLP